MNHQAPALQVNLGTDGCHLFYLTPVLRERLSLDLISPTILSGRSAGTLGPMRCCHALHQNVPGRNPTCNRSNPPHDRSGNDGLIWSLEDGRGDGESVSCTVVDSNVRRGRTSRSSSAGSQPQSVPECDAVRQVHSRILNGDTESSEGNQCIGSSTIAAQLVGFMVCWFVVLGVCQGVLSDDLLDVVDGLCVGIIRVPSLLLVMGRENVSRWVAVCWLLGLN